MRLDEYEIKSIKEIVELFDKDAKIYLFGSRVDDSKRGGDIDLLLLSKTLKKKDSRNIKYALFDKIDEQKIDLIISNDIENPFIRIALNNSILL